MDSSGRAGHSLCHQHRPSQDPPMKIFTHHMCYGNLTLSSGNQKFGRNKCISSVPRSCSLSRKKFCSKFWLKSGVTYFSGELCQKLRNDEGGKSGNQGLLSKHLNQQQPLELGKIAAQIFASIPNTFQVHCCCWTEKSCK